MDMPEHYNRTGISGRGAGFTLIEMLIALAIVVTVMSGIMLLFVGSMNTARQANQQIDAFERARGALNVIKDDLVAAFSSQATADVHNFYGCPVGMMFVGTAKNNVTGARELNISRVSYAIYSGYEPEDNPDDPWMCELPENRFFPAEEGVRSFDGWTYSLIRFVEPGVGDLDTFDIDWSWQTHTGITLQQYIDNAVEDDAENICGNYADPETCREDFIRAKKCEIWMRMLAGGDSELPSIWSKWNRNPCEYVVTEAVYWPIDPQTRYNDPALRLSEDVDWAPYFFQYKWAPSTDSPGHLAEAENYWWNDRRSAQCLPYGEYPNTVDPGRYCKTPCIPELVEVSFELVFAAPAVGVPDFDRRFNLEIFLPTAYRRQTGVS